MTEDNSIDTKLRTILDNNELSITQSDQRYVKKSDILLHEKMFKKLKFLYLEQETRHMFLKEALDTENKFLSEDQSIFDKELESLQKIASQGKDELQHIKEELRAKIDTLTNHTDETYLLLQNFDNRSKNIKDLYLEFDDLESRIEEMLK